MRRTLPVLLLLHLLLAACSPVVQRPTTTSPAPLPETPTNLEGAAGSITLLTWNLGLNDADMAHITSEIAAFQGVDIWTLQETSQFDHDIELLEAAAEQGEGANFESVRGRSGADIPLATFYDADRFVLVDSWEVREINVSGTVRAPLVLHLRELAGDLEFLVVNNHLYRSEEDRRDLQAALLNQWALEQSLPMISGGDFNFDYDVPDGPQPPDAGFGNLTAGGIWEWVQPDLLVPTQCSDSLPCRYDDILDFVFVAGAARDWPATSRIIVRPDDFPDDTLRSDHRPVAAIFYP